jgi:manganese transport protein
MSVVSKGNHALPLFGANLCLPQKAPPYLCTEKSSDETMNLSLKKRIVLALSLVGPGLFLIGYNIGTGSITTMAKAGADYGMTLFWALILSCVFTYVLMVAYGKLTLVTGHTALNNIKIQFSIGRYIAIYIMTAVIIGELLAVMGVMGIVVDLLQEGIRLTFGIENANPWTITGVLVIMLFALLWNGHYKRFEKLLTFFVILMGLCFILVFFMVSPDFVEIARGMVPSIPQEPGSFRLIAAMAGTTCSAAVFVVRSTVVAEKGWNIGNLKTEKRDAMVSASMMLFLSGIIMAVSAGTLHVMGMSLTNTVEMIHLFEPIGGKAAALILILGIAGAGLSTVFPIILIAPWLVCDYTGRERNIQSPLFRWLGLLGLLCSFGFLVMKEKPPALMVFSQAFQACILPAVAIPVYLLLSNRKLMHQHPLSGRFRWGLIAVIIFSMLTTYLAISDLL